MMLDLNTGTVAEGAPDVPILLNRSNEDEKIRFKHFIYSHICVLTCNRAGARFLSVVKRPLRSSRKATPAVS